jgi:RES domain-containing protein
MKVYRITRCDYINDLSGLGASLNGGRWNSEGFYALYTASSASLALLETLAHLNVLPKSGFCIAGIEIPDFSVQIIEESSLSASWNVFPAPIALQQIGNSFIKEGKFLALQLPSALLPEDKVILLNPKHSEFSKVKILYTRPMDIDKRLVK